MILCRGAGALFIKTRKTAGTSVELSLSRYCNDPRDIITPVAQADEALRKRERLPGPRNYGVPSLARRLLLRPPPKRIHGHITATELSTLLPEWPNLFRFSIVRNPWDYAVSRLFWERHRSGNPDLPLDEVLERWDPAQNWNSITINGELAVDFVCRFERLAPDLTTALAHVGIEYDGWLPRAKANTGRGGQHYREFLEPRHVSLIAERCAPEIDAFQYRF